MFQKEKKYFIPLAMLLIASTPLAAHAAEETAAPPVVSAKEMRLTIVGSRAMSNREVGTSVRERREEGETGVLVGADASLDHPTGKHYQLQVGNETTCPFIFTGVDVPGSQLASTPWPSHTRLVPGQQDTIGFELVDKPDVALGNMPVFLTGYFTCEGTEEAQRISWKKLVSIALVNPDKWALICSPLGQGAAWGTTREPRYVSQGGVNCTNQYPYPVQVIARIREGNGRFIFPASMPPVEGEEEVATSVGKTEEDKVTLLFQPYQKLTIPIAYRPYLIGKSHVGKKKEGIFNANLVLIPTDLAGRGAPESLTIPLRGGTFQSPVLWKLWRKAKDVLKQEEQSGFPVDLGTLPKNQIADAALTLATDVLAPYKIASWTVELASDRKEDWLVERLPSENSTILVKLNPGLGLGAAPSGTLTVKAQVRDTADSSVPAREMSWVFPLSAKIEKPVEYKGALDLGRVRTGSPVILSMLPGAPSGLQRQMVKGQLLVSPGGAVVAGAVVGVDPANGNLTLQLSAETPSQLQNAHLVVHIGEDSPDVLTWTISARVYTPVRAPEVDLGSHFAPGDEFSKTLSWPPLQTKQGPPQRWRAWVDSFGSDDASLGGVPWLQLQPPRGELTAGVLPPLGVRGTVPRQARRGTTLSATVIAERKSEGDGLERSEQIEYPLRLHISRKTPWIVDAGMSLHALAYGEPRQHEFLWLSRVGGMFNMASLEAPYYIGLSLSLVGGVSGSFKMAGAQLGLRAGGFLGTSKLMGFAGGAGLSINGDFSEATGTTSAGVWLFLEAKWLLNLGAKIPALHGWSVGVGLDGYFNPFVQEKQRMENAAASMHGGPMLYVQHRFGY